MEQSHRIQHSLGTMAMPASKQDGAASLPLWSRLLEYNADGRQRKRGNRQVDRYQVEIANRLWSLWGTTTQLAAESPNPGHGERSAAGRSGQAAAPGQALACSVIACCAGNFLDLDHWDSKLLDRILVSGQEYYDLSLAARQRRDLTSELTLETLHTSCSLDGQQFWVDIERLVSGKLYSRSKSLGSALNVFFAQHFQTGILQVRDQALAFGFIPEYAAGGAFFMFHCQASGKPLFKDSEQAPYVLRMRQLQQLLYCMLITLDERQRNVPFRIYKIGCVPKT
ncbi:hypothetical protein KR018_002213 [Drosophila ironensis]|nr:hypothetical protein KR018_002213 [Drosophila ironensis]